MIRNYFQSSNNLKVGLFSWKKDDNKKTSVPWAALSRDELESLLESVYQARGISQKALMHMVLAPKSKESVEFQRKTWESHFQMVTQAKNPHQIRKIIQNEAETVKFFGETQRETFESLLNTITQALVSTAEAVEENIENSSELQGKFIVARTQLRHAASTESLHDLRFNLQLGLDSLTASIALHQQQTQQLIEDHQKSTEIMQERLVEVERMCQTDYLTGIMNRQAFEFYGESIIKRNGGGDSVAMLDLNGFKNVNDTYGHEAGDTVLQQFAGCLIRSAGQDATVARLGGDEFAVYFKGPEHRLIRRMEIMVQALTKSPVTVDAEKNERVCAQCSYGTASVGLTETLRPAMKRADEAMYQMKRGNRRAA